MSGSFLVLVLELSPILELNLNFLRLPVQDYSHSKFLLWQVLLGILEVLRRELHSLVHLTIRDRDWIRRGEPGAGLVLLEVHGGVESSTHAIELKAGVLLVLVVVKIF